MQRTAYTTSKDLAKGSIIEIVTFETAEEPQYVPVQGDTIRVTLAQDDILDCTILSVVGKKLNINIGGYISEWDFVKSERLLTHDLGRMYAYQMVA